MCIVDQKIVLATKFALIEINIAKLAADYALRQTA